MRVDYSGEAAKIPNLDTHPDLWFEYFDYDNSGKCLLLNFDF